ncbi:MAG: NAD(P)/FAD-dependent oxidoreductase [Leptonema illini]|uniref:NAD(P)/FAD-dependent oxidoreductase n=1 Tax=Leptonema illini TaxID=183 RepID=A0A833H121_9LEPT|nr:MAG: NAD(P)/FAD-dependent oxidoreductase [Leptonema illini]
MHSKSEERRKPSVIIIGAGMTGILMTIKLKQMGIDEITILEKKEKVGGTWRENTYPGVACDIPAHMYTYSFEPNPEWSHRFAHGDEIQAYFERVSAKYGVTPLVRFNEAVTSARYADARWKVKTSKGNRFTADFVVCATGILHHPARPDIAGLGDFKGAMFHTAEWDHSVDLKGKRVGIIGTGSTAAQVIPELVKLADSVSVFQRTPQWILKIPDHNYSESSKASWRKNPRRLSLYHYLYTKAVEHTFSKAVIGKWLQHRLADYLCRRNLRKSVKDPVLRAKLTPNYRVGCKRIIVNGTFYDAIQKPNAHLITDRIKHIEAKGVVTEDGQLHELDALVLSTGFHPFNFMRPMDLRGEQSDIEHTWQKKVQAYRSIFIPGYPNFFLMLGPNTPIGNFSVIAMSEVQTQYVLKVIEKWRNEEFDAIDARPEALRAYNDYLKAGMSKTVWVGGCQSWYLDQDGDPAMWPYSWQQWVKEMSEPDMRDFTTRTVGQTEPVLTGSGRS